LLGSSDMLVKPCFMRPFRRGARTVGREVDISLSRISSYGLAPPNASKSSKSLRKLPHFLPAREGGRQARRPRRRGCSARGSASPTRRPSRPPRRSSASCLGGMAWVAMASGLGRCPPPSPSIRPRPRPTSRRRYRHRSSMRTIHDPCRAATPIRRRPPAC
jgi:hypothetical protein